MDRIFWIGLIVGAALSFAASIAANLVHSRVTAFFEKRKLVSQLKRKRTAFEFHRIITDLHEGKRDRYLYVSRVLVSMVFGGISSTTAIVGAVVVAGLAPIVPEASWSDPNATHPFISAILLLFFAFKGIL